MVEQPMTPELSRPVPVDHLGGDEAVYEIEADAAERAGLATRFGLLALDSLTATVRLKMLKGQAAVRLRANFSAVVTQTCVATLDPVSEHIEDTCDIEFRRDLEAGGADILVDPEKDAEPLTGDVLDIGEIVATEMALSLNPYPRGGDAPETADVEDSPQEPAIKSPFEILARLKRRP